MGESGRRGLINDQVVRGYAELHGSLNRVLTLLIEYMCSLTTKVALCTSFIVRFF